MINVLNIFKLGLFSIAHYSNKLKMEVLKNKKKNKKHEEHEMKRLRIHNNAF